LDIYFLKYFPKYAKKASRIATVSEYSKQDIVSTYKYAAEKIDVVYNGASESFSPALKGENLLKLPLGLEQGTSYFLFVGALSPRKNIARLLQAFDEFKKSSSSDITLVIVGEKLFMTSDIENVFDKMQHKSDVVFAGRLGIPDLQQVMAAALALVFVPYYEGFGIPLVEAMYSDVPIITSNVTSMPEIAGYAALLIDPFSVDAIKEGMLKIYKDENLRKQLVEKGRQQREKFSWDKTAAKLWDCIEKTHTSK